MFTAPAVLRVVHGKSEVGFVLAQFVSLHDPQEGPLCFRLAGRAWQVVQVEWGKGLLRVRPAERGRVPTWLGQPGVLPEPLCQAMMDVLIRQGGESRWPSEVPGTPAAPRQMELRLEPQVFGGDDAH